MPSAKAAFPEEPLARVRAELSPTRELEGWQLIDVDDGHCWLSFGFRENESLGRWHFDFSYLEPHATAAI